MDDYRTYDYKSYIDLLPAEMIIDNVHLYLRIKKVLDTKNPWRIRYISKRTDFKPEEKFEGGGYFAWKREHGYYVTRIRSEGLTIDEAAGKMYKNIIRIKKGKLSLARY